MFDILRKIWRTGRVTKPLPFAPAPPRFRGKPTFAANDDFESHVSCIECEACVTACPTNAIQLLSAADLRLSYGDCIFCGACAEVCEPGLLQITNEYQLATRDKNQLVATVSNGKEEW